MMLDSRVENENLRTISRGSRSTLRSTAANAATKDAARRGLKSRLMSRASSLQGRTARKSCGRRHVQEERCRLKSQV